MGLCVGHTVSALELLQIGRDIKVECGPFKPNDPAGDAALAAVFQMMHQADSSKLGCDNIWRLANDDVSPGEIPRRHQRDPSSLARYCRKRRIYVIASNQRNIRQ